MWLNLAESELKNPNPNSNSKPAVPEFDPQVISMFKNSLQELPSDDPFQIKDDQKVGVSERGGGGGGGARGSGGVINTKGVPAKVLWYFPPILRFRRMFQSPKTANDLKWHAQERENDGKLRHPADSPTWQLVNQMWPQFAQIRETLDLPFQQMVSILIVL